MRHQNLLTPIFALALAGAPQGLPAQAPKTVAAGEVIQRIIQQEANLIDVLERSQPIAETYIQVVAPDEVLGTRVTDDVYFIGKINLTNGVDVDLFTPEARRRRLLPSLFAKKVRFLPRGFAQMAFIDSSEFDLEHYEFRYVQREFVGEVRCLVFDLAPRKGAGSGRFIGRIWAEDRGFHIVRFSGTYTSRSKQSPYFHLSSWRSETGAGAWLPSFIYVEELDQPASTANARGIFRGQVRIWGYKPDSTGHREEMTSIRIEAPLARDDSENRDISAVEAMRKWERQAEVNILERLEKGSLLAPKGDADQVLETVVNNLLVSNKETADSEVHCRILLTTPIESFTIGHTIVLSRGLVDALPDEAGLAAVLASELAHILLGHTMNTKYAFNDQTLVDDSKMFEQFHFQRDPKQAEEAGRKAMELLRHSPYKDKLAGAGLFLRAAAEYSERMPNLFRPRLGNPLAENGQIVGMPELLKLAPKLEPANLQQIAALPLGSRVKLDPWTNRVELARASIPKLLSPREKMPFGVTPLMLALARRSPATSRAGGASVAAPGPAAPGSQAASAVTSTPADGAR